MMENGFRTAIKTLFAPFYTNCSFSHFSYPAYFQCNSQSAIAFLSEHTRYGAPAEGAELALGEGHERIYLVEPMVQLA